MIPKNRRSVKLIMFPSDISDIDVVGGIPAHNTQSRTFNLYFRGSQSCSNTSLQRHGYIQDHHHQRTGNHHCSARSKAQPGCRGIVKWRTDHRGRTSRQNPPGLSQTLSAVPAACPGQACRWRYCRRRPFRVIVRVTSTHTAGAEDIKEGRRIVVVH